MRKILSTIFAFVLAFTALGVNPLVNADEYEYVWSSTNGGDVSTVVRNGVRYERLTPTSANNTSDKAGEFRRNDMKWNWDELEGSASFEFVADSEPGGSRFGVNVLHADMSNYVTVGYDTGGWFWEYKIDGGGTWYTGKRMAAPSKGTNVVVDVTLKDYVIKATITETLPNGEQKDPVEAISHQLEEDTLRTLLEKSAGNDNIAIRLGSGTSVLVKSHYQDDIMPSEPVERPDIDKYDEYNAVFNFEGLTEEKLDALLLSNTNLKYELVDHDESKGLKVDFIKGRNLLYFAGTPLIHDFELEADITPTTENLSDFGFVTRLEGDTTVYVGVGENGQYGVKHNAPEFSTDLVEGPTLETNKTNRWKVSVSGEVITLSIDGKEVFKEEIEKLPAKPGAFGFYKENGEASVIIDNVEVTRLLPDRPDNPNTEGEVVYELKSGEMTVKVDESFPRVIEYDLGGEKLGGQATVLDTVIINGHEIVPEVEVKAKDASSIDYLIKAVDLPNNVYVDLYATISVEDNIMTFEITKIHNRLDGKTDDTIIRTIKFPNHALVSVSSKDPNANLMGAKSSTNTTVKGDTLTKVTDRLRSFSQGYMYAVISDTNLSASIYSNSQVGTNVREYNRIEAVITEFLDFNQMGLHSSEFIYQREARYDIDTHNLDNDLPKVQVVVTGDANNDGTIDWNDGAIAARDIVYLPIGADDVKDLVAYRIAMNFGSHAQNPFLMTLDNIKKVNAHTDGLGQSILHKGYGSEGHDSGHLNYADVGRRIGGTPEFKELLRQSKDYGAKVGIHVNASETYPESKYFTEELLRRNGDDYNYGWNWIDQGINIDASYDLANGRRARFEDLYHELGGKDNDLDWIYVDVWGNGQSGDDAAWGSHQLAKEINDLGWRLGGEWGYAFQPDTTFSHWATDLTYGGYQNKGLNSDLARFILNSKRDTWTAHYPRYSGASDYPLLEGYNMKDFEGWQGRNDYDGYMLNLFENNVPTKFIQHFEPMKWELGETVEMKGDVGVFNYTPEKRVTLEGDLGTLVIERKSEDYTDLNNFRGKNMYLNGKLVQTTNVGDLAKADIQYLLPWSWDHDGNELAEDAERLYHFNKQGGESTWELPEGWTVSNVKVYQLTETGRKLVDTVEVVNGKVTLTAEANTTYTVYKGEQKKIEVTYGDGAHLDDPSFNNQNLDVWNVKGEGAQVEKSQATNDMLSIRDNVKETTVSQILHDDLEPGKEYVAYVGVDNRADAAARLTVKFDGQEYSNYTNKSIAKNYVKAYGHNTNSSTIEGNSYFQNLFVYFTAPKAGTKIELVLSRDGGDGVAFFDDVRVTRNDGNPIQADGSYFQDFEESAQGIAPFVVGNVEGVEDNRTHLSEFNAPYTQRGWNDKKISDVIDGNWSLKTNGLTERNRLVYQTIPQNVRFEPGVEYTVTFDYELGSEGTYAVVVGDGEVTGEEVKDSLKATLNEDGALTYTTTITGSDTGQTWFGIWSTTVAADLGDSTDKTANFRSYKDIMLDNVSVAKVEEPEEPVNPDENEKPDDNQKPGDIEKPGDNEKPVKPGDKVPPTGISSNVTTWVLISAVALVIFAFFTKRKRKEV